VRVSEAVDKDELFERLRGKRLRERELARLLKEKGSEKNE